MGICLLASVEWTNSCDDVDEPVWRDSPVLDGLIGLKRSPVGDGSHAILPLPGDECHVVTAPDPRVRTHPRVPIALATKISTHGTSMLLSIGTYSYVTIQVPMSPHFIIKQHKIRFATISRYRYIPTYLQVKRFRDWLGQLQYNIQYNNRVFPNKRFS